MNNSNTFDHVNYCTNDCADIELNIHSTPYIPDTDGIEIDCNDDETYEYIYNKIINMDTRELKKMNEVIDPKNSNYTKKLISDGYSEDDAALFSLFVFMALTYSILI